MVVFKYLTVIWFIDKRGKLIEKLLPVKLIYMLGYDKLI